MPSTYVYLLDYRKMETTIATNNQSDTNEANDIFDIVSNLDYDLIDKQYEEFYRDKKAVDEFYSAQWGEV